MTDVHQSGTQTCAIRREELLLFLTRRMPWLTWQQFPAFGWRNCRECWSGSGVFALTGNGESFFAGVYSDRRRSS